MSLHFLNSGDKKKILSELEERYGLFKHDYIFVVSGKEKIRAFSGTMNRDELNRLSEFARVEFAGAYFARQEPFGLRLSFDMSQILSKEFKKNIIDLDREQFVSWMKGHSITVDFEDGLYLVRYEGDFLGSGHLRSGKLNNYVPKERQLRKLT